MTSQASTCQINIEINRGDMRKIKILSIEDNVLDMGSSNSLICIHYKYKAFSLMQGFFPIWKFDSFIKITIFKDVRNPKTSGSCEGYFKGFGFNLIPSLDYPPKQWPKWYYKIWKSLSYRNWSVDGYLKKHSHCEVDLNRSRK